MKKILCTSIVLLFIIGGITAAFAAGVTADGGKVFASEGTVAAESTGAAVKASGSDESASDAAIVAATGSAAAVTTESAVTTSPAVETTGDAVTTTAPAVTTADMTFTGDPIKLSLDAAYEKMASDSPQAEIAKLNQQGADGIARGYGESVSLINKSERLGGDYSTTDRNILKIQQEYASTQGSRNYEAEMNKLKSDTLENYYTLKELENQVQIAKDNLALKEKLLSNTQLKYKLGTVSKSDVLQAEISVYEAKDSLLAAENGLIKMKMGFNQFMGYDLMQNVVLTDTVKEVDMPQKSLAASIKDALMNRNEILEANYNVAISTLNLNNYEAYPRSSSRYIKAKMSMLMAETSKKNAPLTVESDVRTKYLAINEKYSAVQTGKKSVENAKESARLAQLQYDAGMATLSDVEGAQLALYNTQLDYSKALLEYNIAVNDYKLASTVGTTTSSLGSQ